MELVKSEIELKEHIIVAFFLLQYAELRKLEQYYNFFDKYCDVTKFEELAMDAYSLYLALSEHDLKVCKEKRVELCVKKRLRMNFQPTQQQISSLVLAPLSARATIDENMANTRKNSAAKEQFVFVAKYISVMTYNQTNSF